MFDNLKHIKGAGFKKPTFHRPTSMSVAMSDAGIIPGTHLRSDLRITAVVRQSNDYNNERPSVRVMMA